RHVPRAAAPSSAPSSSVPISLQRERTSPPVTLADLLARFPDVETSPDGWLVHCPAHDDSRQSLRFAVSDAGKILVRCRAGCETPRVVEALGLTMRDLATMTPGDVPAEKRAVSQDVP